MKTKYTIILWIGVFALLFTYLQLNYAFYFFFIEQNQLFLWSWDYLWKLVAEPGGLALWIGECLVQFFSYPYLGALLMALLLTSTAIWMSLLLKRISPNRENIGLSLLIPVLLFIPITDFNYLLQGTVAFIGVLKALYFYTQIESSKRRMWLAVCFLPILFWAIGAAALIFAVTASLYEWLKRTRGAYLSLILPVEVLLIAAGCFYFSILGSYRLGLLPDAYYHINLVPKFTIYFAWIALPSILLIVYQLKKLTTKATSRQILIVEIIQLFLLTLVAAWASSQCKNESSYHLKELDYYARNEQWQKIYETSRGEKLTNYLYINYLNTALSRQGFLADSLFHYDQRGEKGLFIPWNKTVHISTILSDTYFAMGNIANAQEMAFEANVSTQGEGNPRMLKRLIQTNLINGDYPVAEKYIRMLEQTYAYEDWAKRHRKFLYNDTEVKKDSLLGRLQACLVEQNYLIRTEGLAQDLLRTAQQNPSYSPAIHYLGSLLLLKKDLKGFKMLIDSTYGTELLPKLPLSFQEAMIILTEKTPKDWERFGIRQEVVQRFLMYKNQILANKANQAALPNIMRHSYGNTYWFYFMYK